MIFGVECYHKGHGLFQSMFLAKIKEIHSTDQESEVVPYAKDLVGGDRISKKIKTSKDGTTIEHLINGKS